MNQLLFERIGGVNHTGAILVEEVVITKLEIIWVIWVTTYNGAKIPLSMSNCRHLVNRRAVHHGYNIPYTTCQKYSSNQLSDQSPMWKERPTITSKHLRADPSFFLTNTATSSRQQPSTELKHSNQRSITMIRSQNFQPARYKRVTYPSSSP
ncbi:hypothetical protein ASPFODRAFT_506207 [Aspergillus luchuensis CBS 106.47]|uniref:Uncharacterized protein n=1 Tax=Aspergillus luchuensis (strain CBS 106.47) TaxID=1137211 RepID=A0A1M3TSV6_ASPLC|nr:hypothetical protein ASPFODRAFT_506207 [Aspergillus luchuensis CBS 106.47]